jgi:TRAP-type C4-dicarboxylate transport system substrate-binding protein
MSKTTKIRWVIAHEPLNLFLRAAEDFERRVNEQQSEHKIEVEIMTLSEYSQRYNDGVVVTKHDLLDLMEAGKIEMSQMYTTWLAEKYEQDFLVFDLPFLFKDHDHASRVLEGEVGEYLLDSIKAKSNVKGLAFTYSGGFRCILSAKDIRTLADFVGTSIRSNKNPMAMETFRAIGAEPIAMELEEINSGTQSGVIVGGETAYPRIYPLEQNQYHSSVVDSEHSLFLTSIIITDQFWNSLDPELQNIIKTAAIKAGRAERVESIKDGEEAKVKLESEGKPVVRLSEQDQKEFRRKTQVVYKKFENFFSPGLVDKIRQSQ